MLFDEKSESLFAEPDGGPYCENTATTAANNLAGRPTIPAVQPGVLPPEQPPAPDAGYEYLDDAYGEVAASWYDPANIPTELLSVNGAEEGTEPELLLSGAEIEPEIYYPDTEGAELFSEELPQPSETEPEEPPQPCKDCQEQDGFAPKPEEEQTAPEQNETEPAIYYWTRG